MAIWNTLTAEEVTSKPVQQGADAVPFNPAVSPISAAGPIFTEPTTLVKPPLYPTGGPTNIPAGGSNPAPVGIAPPGGVTPAPAPPIDTGCDRCGGTAPAPSPVTPTQPVHYTGGPAPVSKATTATETPCAVCEWFRRLPGWLLLLLLLAVLALLSRRKG